MKIEKILFASVFAIAAMVASVSCTTSKGIHYFRDIDDVTMTKLTEQYEPVIMKDDKLMIIVTGPDKTVVSPYNFTLADFGRNAGIGNSSEAAVIPYLVDSNGYIDMPGLGHIKVEGLRRIDLVNKITKMLKAGGLVKDPVVSVKFMNYKVTILGAVKSPGTYTMETERNTILQALGRAGDLDMTARRDKIMLIRNVDGVHEHHIINLKKADILNSPYFYLHQNDVIYVPASPSRINFGTSAAGTLSLVLSTVSSALALVTAVIALTK